MGKIFGNFTNAKQFVKFWFREIPFHNTAKMSDIIVDYYLINK